MNRRGGMDNCNGGKDERSWLGQVLPDERPEALDRLALCIDYDESARTGVVVLGAGDASSLKASNLLLNWRKVTDFANEAALETAGAASISWWLVPLAALHLAQNAQRRATIQVSRVDAMVLFVLWQIRQEDGLPGETAWKAAQDSLRHEGSSELTYKQFTASLDNLIELRAVEMIAGRIYPREHVKLS